MLDGCHAFPKRAPHRQCILLALLLALYSASVWPQTQLATVFGTITDSTGAVITEAQVTVSGINTGWKRVGLTDIKGEYHMAGLPPGMYTVLAEKEKFQTRVLEGVDLRSGAAIAINLSLGIGTVAQNVTVKADAAIDTTTSIVGEAITERSLTGLPLNGRDLFKTAILEPGVSPTPSSAPSLLSDGKASQLSVAGMRPSWTNVLIDGMDANDPVFGFSPAGASGLFLGMNGLTEVRVLTQTVGPEYGTKGGGVIESFTKSGTNQFRASIGGPLMRGRTFFFANYEGFREVQASTAIATVPNGLARQGFLPSV